MTTLTGRSMGVGATGALQEHGTYHATMEQLRERLAKVLEQWLGNDREKAGHTRDVLELAERIGEQIGADPLVIVPAAVLHDIGRAAPERAGAAGCGTCSSAEATELLDCLDLPTLVKQEVKDLIRNWHQRHRMTSPNGAALFDADLIANLQGKDSPHWEAVLATVSLTTAGKQIGSTYLAHRNHAARY